MLNVSLMVFGVIGLTRLPVRELPDVDAPVVNVLTVYPGAAAEVVESEVTELLEDAVSGVEGIKILSSTSREQVSSLRIEFNTGQDIDIAAQDVRDAVGRSRGDLPDDVDEPVISKEDANARPVMWISFFSDRFTTEELTRIADDQVRERLQTVRGVSSVIIGGEKRRAIRLRLDRARMASRGVTVRDVDMALRNQNVDLPSGRLESADTEFTIQTRGELKTPEAFERLVVRKDGDAVVYLQNVGVAEWGVEDERAIARFNGRPSVGLGVVRQSKANTLEVAEGIKATMAVLAPGLPDGIDYAFPYDESVFVERAVIEVWQTLGIAFALVALTIFVFLRSPRATLIPVMAIPVSILATFGGMYALGFSVNIFTLLALVLAIGLVVDDAIVVLENIYRHLEEGHKPMDAAFMAMDEISFAVIATTLSLVAVFLPLAFIGGITGRLLLEFAVALSVAVIISSLVALTLAPMVGARVLRAENTEDHGRVFKAFERFFDRIADRYDRALGWVLRHRLAVMVIGGLSVLLSGYFFLHLDQEFLPEEDKGRMLTIGITPEGSTPEYTDRMVRQVEEIFLATPEIDMFFAAVALPFNGPGDATQAFIFTRFIEGDRPHVRDLVGGPNGIRSKLFSQVEGGLFFPILPKAVDAGIGQPFELILQHPDLDTLNQATGQVMGALAQGGYVANARPLFQMNKPEIEVVFDRDRAADLGVSIAEVGRALQVNFGGLDLSDIKLDGKQYEVIAQLADTQRATPEDLRTLNVRTRSGRAGAPGLRGAPGGQDRAQSDRPIPAPPRVHHRGHPHRHAGPGDRTNRGHVGGNAARRRGIRLGGRGPGFARDLARHLLVLFSRRDRGVHGAGRAIREFYPPLHRHAVAAAGLSWRLRAPVWTRLGQRAGAGIVRMGHLRSGSAGLGGGPAKIRSPRLLHEPQHLQSGGIGSAGGTGEQKLDSAGGIRQSTHGQRHDRGGGDARGREKNGCAPSS